MQYGLSEEQEMIASTVRSLLKTRFIRMRIWSSAPVKCPQKCASNQTKDAESGILCLQFS